MSEGHDIVLLSQARQLLAEARDIPEVSDLREKALAMERYLKRKEGAEESARIATDIRLRAERRIGEMLAETVHPGNPQLCREGTIAKLPDAVTRKQSSHYQRIAALPEPVFEQELAKPEPTTARLVKVAKQHQAQNPLAVERENDLRADPAFVTRLEQLLERGMSFGTIYADPPWQYGNQATRASTNNHYVTMPVDEIAALPVEKLAAPNAHLHLWTTNAFLPASFDLMRAWGFEYKSVFVWVKPEMGIGNYWRVSHEFMLFGIRGKAPFQSHAEMSWMHHPRTAHSAKPEKIRELVQRVSPGPYLELFGRRLAKDWVVWGNQIERTMFDGDAREIA